MSTAFTQVQRFLRETTGAHIDNDKLYLLEDRLRPVMKSCALSSLDELALALQDRRNKQLADMVMETVTINETSFFRDRALFKALGDTLLPALMEARSASRHLRIWCAGCSTGQEPYSIAMLIDERLRQPGWQIDIVATDLSRPVIERAQRGSYSQFEVQRGLPVASLLKHFTRHGDAWQISDALRSQIRFRTQNLMAIPAEFGRFDLIFCRNVLIYFDPPTKRQVLIAIKRHLNPDGYLILGGGERLRDLGAGFEADGIESFVFKPQGTEYAAVPA